MSLKNRMNVKKDLVKQIEEEESNKSGGDKRTLNFFDLKFNEKMTILFTPDSEGNIWKKYRRHSAPKGVRGVEGVGCSGSSSCPICQKGFDIYEAFHNTEDKAEKERIKNEAKNYWPKDIMLTSCIVIDSPCDINVSDDGNDVKLFYLPFAIEKIIKESLVEEQVTEETICSTPFVIKQTKNQGGKAAYDSSYFAREQLSDDDFEALDEELTTEWYTFDELDLIPTILDDDDALEWAEALEAKIAAAAAKKGNGGTDKKSVANRLNRGKTSAKVSDSPAPDTDYDEEIPDSFDEKGDGGDPAEEEQKTTTSSSLRDRLRQTSR